MWCWRGSLITFKDENIHQFVWQGVNGAGITEAIQRWLKCMTSGSQVPPKSIDPPTPERYQCHSQWESNELQSISNQFDLYSSCLFTKKLFCFHFVLFLLLCCMLTPNMLGNGDNKDFVLPSPKIYSLDTCFRVSTCFSFFQSGSMLLLSLYFIHFFLHISPLLHHWYPNSRLLHP